MFGCIVVVIFFNIWVAIVLVWCIMVILVGVLICIFWWECFFVFGVGEGMGEGGVNNWLSKFIGWVFKNLGYVGFDFF